MMEWQLKTDASSREAPTPTRLEHEDGEVLLILRYVGSQSHASSGPSNPLFLHLQECHSLPRLLSGCAVVLFLSPRTKAEARQHLPNCC